MNLVGMNVLQNLKPAYRIIENVGMEKFFESRKQVLKSLTESKTSLGD